MDVGVKENLNAKLEVNLKAELDEAAKGCEVEAAKLSFSANSEPAECEEVDDAYHTCPKSVGLDNEIPSDAQLEADGFEMRTTTEAECRVGMSLSSTEAPVNEVFNEAQVESGGFESMFLIDSESAVVTISSPEPSVTENDVPNGLEWSLMLLNLKLGLKAKFWMVHSPS